METSSLSNINTQQKNSWKLAFWVETLIGGIFIIVVFVLGINKSFDSLSKQNNLPNTVPQQSSISPTTQVKLPEFPIIGNWSVFSSPEFPFTFQYPQNWQLAVNTPSQGTVEVTCQNCQNNLGTYQFLIRERSEQQFIIHTSDVSTYLSQEWLDYAQKEQKRHDECLALKGKPELKDQCLPRVPGKSFDLLNRVDKLFPEASSAAEISEQGYYTDLKEGESVWHYVVLDNEQPYEIVLTAPEKSWLKYSPSVDELNRNPQHPLIQMAQSVKFIH